MLTFCFYNYRWAAKTPRTWPHHLTTSGGVYDKKGDLENALVQYQKALEIRTRVFGSDHPDVAASYNNIGEVCRKQGKYEEALEVYTKSLDMMTRIYGGDNHPSVADSKYNLALLHKKRKETP